MVWAGLAVAAVIVIVAAFLISQGNNPGTTSNTTNNTTTNTTEEETRGETRTYDLNAQNNSGQDGTVKLEEVGSQTRVTISVANGSSMAQPAHIHLGVCPLPGAVQFPLSDVVNGKSETMIEASLIELADLGALSVNVHKSEAESDVYTSCGNLDL